MKVRNYHILSGAFINLIAGQQTSVIDTTDEPSHVTDSGVPTLVDACVELLGGVLLASVTVTLERLDNLSQNWAIIETRTVPIAAGLQRSVHFHTFAFETIKQEGSPGETCLRLRVQSNQALQVLGNGLTCMRVYNPEAV